MCSDASARFVTLTYIFKKWDPVRQCTTCNCREPNPVGPIIRYKKHTTPLRTISVSESWLWYTTPGQSIKKILLVSVMYCHTLVSPGIGATLQTWRREKNMKMWEKVNWQFRDSTMQILIRGNLQRKLYIFSTQCVDNWWFPNIWIPDKSHAHGLLVTFQTSKLP